MILNLESPDVLYEHTLARRRSFCYNRWTMIGVGTGRQPALEKFTYQQARKGLYVIHLVYSKTQRNITNMTSGLAGVCVY